VRGRGVQKHHAGAFAFAKGPAKKKVGDPRGGWVGQSTKKDWGQIYFFDIFLIVFLNSPHQETPKNVIKKIREKVIFGFLVEFLAKTFRHDFFCKTFFVVFLNSHR
jgi:hypothetical protein